MAMLVPAIHVDALDSGPGYLNSTRLPLKDARRAHEMIEARQVIGKMLLKPE